MLLPMSLPRLGTQWQLPTLLPKLPRLQPMFLLRSMQVSMPWLSCDPAFSRSPSETLTTKSLDRLGLIINRVHRTLICMACHVSVNHYATKAHFSSPKHKGHKVTPEDLESLAREIVDAFPAGLVYPPVVPAAPVDAVFGLKATRVDYLLCSNCQRWFKGPDPASFHKHACDPRTANPPRNISQTSPVQQFLAPQNSAKFPVRLPAASEPVLSVFDQYQQQRARRPVKEVRISIPENHRLMHQFLDKEGWLEHLKKQSPVALNELHKITLKDLRFPNLARHVERYLLDLQKKKPSTHVRRLIGTRPNTE